MYRLWVIITIWDALCWMKIIINCAIELSFFNGAQRRPVIFQPHPIKQWDQLFAINSKALFETKCPAGTCYWHLDFSPPPCILCSDAAHFAPVQVSQPPEADTAGGLSQPFQEKRRVSVTWNTLLLLIVPVMWFSSLSDFILANASLERNIYGFCPNP